MEYIKSYIKINKFDFKDPHYIYNGNSYTDKTTSLYCDGPQKCVLVFIV